MQKRLPKAEIDEDFFYFMRNYHGFDEDFNEALW